MSEGFHPGFHHSPTTVLVRVSLDLLPELAEWSEPVKVQIQKTEYDTGYMMVFKRHVCNVDEEGKDMKLLGFTILTPNDIAAIKLQNENLQSYISSGAVEDAPEELFHKASNVDWVIRNTLGED